jgi:hypothetical protein
LIGLKPATPYEIIHLTLPVIKKTKKLNELQLGENI